MMPCPHPAAAAAGRTPARFSGRCFVAGGISSPGDPATAHAAHPCRGGRRTINRPATVQRP
ncbi:MAG: hypothetical protein ABTQ73_04065, partial [Caldilineales bacterium]